MINIGYLNQNEVINCMQQADILFPTRSEGFGMVAIEAAAHGTPTVAFSTGGIVDAVKDGHSGYLIDNGNYNKLVEIVINSTITPMSEKKVVLFSSQFAWRKFSEKLNDHF